MEEELRQHSEHLEQLVEVRTRKLRQTEQDLRSTKERLEYLLASNPAAIYSAKPLADGSDFHMTYVSEAVASILGFEPREFIGHPEFWDDLIHPEDRRSVFAEVPVLWKEGQHMFEYRLRHRDGNYRWIREESRLVRDADGKPIEVNGYWIDVTELKRMEEELRHAQRMATIGELAAMVGHDLRNPLTGISGAAYYLNESLPPTVDDRAKEMLTVIEQAVEYADGIMNDLVQYSGEMRLTMTGAGPRSIVEQALGLVGVPEDVRVSNLTSDETKIMVDAARMKRAFVNLIKNAVDAMPEGGELTITSSKSDGNLQIVVSDTGTGIKQEGIARIGTPFYTTKAKGMGLGLSICKRIVEAHGGSLTVESKDGGGTKVTVTVPINAGRREVKAND
jgi:PAS domain S-box-containing protein